MTDPLAGVIGGAIILAVALDVFRSLLVPRASGRWLRVGPALNAVLFAAWHATASRIARLRLRQTIRASFAPLMLVLIMAVWAGIFRKAQREWEWLRTYRRSRRIRRVARSGSGI